MWRCSPIRCTLSSAGLNWSSTTSCSCAYAYSRKSCTRRCCRKSDSLRSTRRCTQIRCIRANAGSSWSSTMNRSCACAFSRSQSTCSNPTESSATSSALYCSMYSCARIRPPAPRATSFRKRGFASVHSCTPCNCARICRRRRPATMRRNRGSQRLTYCCTPLLYIRANVGSNWSSMTSYSCAYDRMRSSLIRWSDTAGDCNTVSPDSCRSDTDNLYILQYIFRGDGPRRSRPSGYTYADWDNTLSSRQQG